MAVYRGVPWRFLFTDLGTVTTTWADGLLTNRKISLTLDQPTVIEADVWPDDGRVNRIFTDGYPLIAQSKRLIYGFRREGVGATSSDTTPWVCRAAGILMSPEDQADTDIPLSHITAYDPWKYLEGRIAVNNDGSLPGPQGLLFFDHGNNVALQLLLNTVLTEAAVDGVGNGVFIDAGNGSRIGEGSQYADWGGTSFYTGTIVNTPSVNFTVQQGSSVASVWQQLCDAGNMDIVLRPIYDPVNRPGYTHEVSIYELAGNDRANAVFGWDRMRRNLKRIDRMHDGTPGSFFNKGIYFSGQGGFPLPSTGPLTNGASIGDFGTYWATQFFPNQLNTDPTGSAVLSLLTQALRMARQGRRTVTMDPIPERAPVPLEDYEPGDRVKIYVSKNLRTTIAGYERVEAIPIAIQDDGIEVVSSLLVSPDWRDNVTPPPVEGPVITYVYDGAETLTVSIPTRILVGLASDDDVFLVSDDGTTQDDVLWPDAIVTSDPAGAYGPVLTLTLTGIVYEPDSGPPLDYFVTPRNAMVFRAALLVMAGTDAAAGQTPPDLTTFARIGPVKAFTYGVAATVTSPPFNTLPMPLPLPTGGGSGGSCTPTGATWNWDAGAGTVDAGSAAFVSAWLSYAIGSGTYFTAAVAVQDAPAGTASYNIPTSEAVTPVSAPVPLGTRAGASNDLSLTVRAGSTDYDFGLAVYNSGTTRISSCFGGTVTPTSAVYEVGPNSANAACFPLRQGPITLADIDAGCISHPLAFTMPNPGPAPNRYPARPGSAGYPSNTGFPLGTWMRLNPAVDVASLGLSAFETMVCVALQTYGMFCRDIGSTFDIIGVDPVNQGGDTTGPWVTRGVNLDVDNGHGVLYAVAFSGSMPWSSMQVLQVPSP